MIKETFIYCVLLLLNLSTIAQPCLDGWVYRKEIIIDNLANSENLSNFQVKLSANLKSLIDQGKLNSDVSDLRFVNANEKLLNFWLDSNTIHDSITEIWINIPAIPSSSIFSIYMLYGANSASNIMSGDSTFELFDDFNNTSLNTYKWDFCGSGTYSLNSGSLYLSASLGAKSILTSKSTFEDELVIETKVLEVSNSAFIGLKNENGAAKGYALEYSNTPYDLFELKSLGISTSCFDISSLSPVKADNCNNPIGKWSYSWSSLGEHNYSWTDNSISYDDISTIYPNNIKTTFGIQDEGGDIKLDYFFARKYAAIEPTVTLSEEEQVIALPPLNIVTNSPVCNGDTLFLKTDIAAEGTYVWSGSNGFSSMDSVAIIPIMSYNEGGIYYLSVSSENDCDIDVYQVDVQVSDSTVPGNLNGADTVCVDVNSGVLKLSSYLGDVNRWEVSSTGNAPWSTISNHTDSLLYDSLQETQFYRAIVKNGGCGEAASNDVGILVNQSSEGGVILGNNEVCAQNENGSISLTSYVGNIINWQYSTDAGTNWDTINTSTSTYNFPSLNSETQFRAEVKNGVCESNSSDVFIVNVSPIPDVKFDFNGSCENQITEFTDSSSLSSGSIISYQWDFNDGYSSTAQNPVHTYTSKGSYNVVLLLNTDEGCSNDTSVSVNINATPSTGFNNSKACEDSEINFINLSSISSGSITQFNWIFEPDSIFTEENPTYIFQNPGNYNVKLKTISDSGCVDSALVLLTVSSLPKPSFTVDSTCLGDASNFINTTSNSNFSYDWYFGDGNSSQNINPSYTYSNGGNYAVLLEAENSIGCTNTFIDSIIVSESPQIDILFSNHCEGDSLQITNNSTVNSGSIFYNWSFGDGNSSSLNEPSHKYSTFGTYNLQLTVNSSTGCSSFFNSAVEVFLKPQVNFLSPNVCTNTSVDFTNVSSIGYGSLNHFWNFDDGDTSTVENPIHSFSLEGSYDVKLISTSDNGCTDSISKTVISYPNPVASFAATSPCDGVESQFTNTTTLTSGTISTFNWSFSDGGSASIENPAHQYLNYGTYQSSLKVTSNYGCVDDTLVTVYVNEAPVANFEAEDGCFGEKMQFENSSYVSNGSITSNWKFGDDAVSVVESPEHKYSSAGLFPVTLKVTTNNNCVDSLTKGVYVYSLPKINAGNDTSISKGFSVQLESTGGQNCSWQPFESLDNSMSCSPTATPMSTTSYVVTSGNEFGCISTDTIRIEVKDDFIVIPSNVITPDGNLKNDTWYVQNIESYPSNIVSVLDRTGRMVYRKANYQNDWNGKFGRDILPEGTYYYIIQFSDRDEVYKGALTILRGE